MTILAETVDAVIGVDTHRDSHALQMRSAAGLVLAETEVPNSGDGFAEALAWAVQHAPGPRIVVGMEGTRSYGVGLARAFAAAGVPVVEVERPRRSDRRRGKSDPIDAGLAAANALRMDADALPSPRADGTREALRILLAARSDMARLSTARTNAFRALLLSGDDRDRDLARGNLPVAVLQGVARRRGTAGEDVEGRVRRGELRRLARSLQELRTGLADNKEQLAALVRDLAPGLLELRGVGPATGARVLAAWSHPGRCRDDAAFASLAGACPVPASSGRTVRHRLNRGGDRDLNSALHVIAVTRARCDPATIAYVERRRAQGLTDKEIRRCLKRYIARQLHRRLTRDHRDARPGTTAVQGLSQGNGGAARGAPGPA